MTRPAQDLIRAAVASAREGLRDDWEWRGDVMANVLAAVADDLAEARKLLERWRADGSISETLEISTDAFLERTK